MIHHQIYIVRSCFFHQVNRSVRRQKAALLSLRRVGLCVKQSRFYLTFRACTVGWYLLLTCKFMPHAKLPVCISRSVKDAVEAFCERLCLRRYGEDGIGAYSGWACTSSSRLLRVTTRVKAQRGSIENDRTRLTEKEGAGDSYQGQALFVAYLFFDLCLSHMMKFRYFPPCSGISMACPAEGQVHEKPQKTPSTAPA